MSKRGVGGAKATRHKVKCCICNEEFDNDYAERHTHAKHRDLAAVNRIAPITSIGMKMVKDPWSAAAVVKKKLRIDGQNSDSIVDTCESEDDNRSTPIEVHEEEAQQQHEEADSIVSADSEGDIPDSDFEDDDPAGLISTNAACSEVESGASFNFNIEANQLLTKSPPGPKDISQSSDEVPMQPKNVSFPRHLIGPVYRSFNPSKYEIFKWLEYSVSEDAVFCHCCRHFGKRESGHFISSGFRTWNKCHGKDKTKNSLLQHEVSESHIQALSEYGAFTMMKKTNSSEHSVLGMLSTAHAQSVEENRHYIRTLCEVLLLTSEMKIAQRETGRYYRVNDCEKDSSHSAYAGNFLTILSAIAKHDPIIARKIQKGPQNAKYTHHTIQNALLNIMSHLVLEQIAKELSEAEFFSIMADETKDVSKREVISVCIRYLYDNAIHEEFVGICETDNLDAKSLKNSIVRSLLTVKADLKKCVGQGYDGASVVAGKLNGVQALFRDEHSHLAQYIHCFAHRLNLVVLAIVHNMQPIFECFSFLQSLYTFISCATIHPIWVHLQEEKKLRTMTLKAISETRWSCQANMLSVVCSRIEVLFELLEIVAHHHHNNEKINEAKAHLLQFDLSLLRLILALEKVFRFIKTTSDFLQNPTSDISQTNEIILNLRENLASCRTESFCSQIWSQAETIGQRLGLTERTQLKKSNRVKKMPSHLRDSLLLTAMSNRERNSTLQEFRVEVFSVVDRITTELDRRFCSQNIEIMTGISALTPSSEHFLNKDMVLPFGESYECDLTDLSIEIQNCQRMMSRATKRPTSLMDLCRQMRGVKDALPEMSKLTTIACTIPVSSSACERSFSTLRIVKNYLRSSMKSDRANDLMILGIHATRAKKLDLNEVINRFLRKYPKCRIILS